MATLPNPNPIYNSARVNYQYIVNPSVPITASNANLTNSVNTQINQAIINNSDNGMVKSANPSTAQLGNTVTYTVILKNTGNVTANNVTFSDTIPSGTVFANSVTVNGVVMPGANPNPPSSIPVGNIGPGSVSTVTFNVTIVTLPVSGTIPNDSTVNFTYTANPSVPNGQSGSGNSNTSSISVNQAIIDNINGGGMNKYAHPISVNIGDTVIYTIALKNTGNATANNVTLSDTIPVGTSFAGNVTLNGVAVPGANPNPPSSIPIGSIGPNSTSTVTFNVTITTLPSSGTIPNDSTVRFTYTKNPTIPNGQSSSGNSNTAIIGVTQAIIDYTNGGGMVKSTNPSYTKLGDLVTYTIRLKNTGNTTANNVNFSDTIPVGTSFANNVTVNGVAVPGGNPNPPSSIPVGSIGPNAVSTVTFNVTVTTLPASGTIPNDSTVRFTYTGNASIPNGQSGSGNSNTAIIGANQAIIDYTNGGGLVKSANPTYVRRGDTVIYTIALKNTGNTTANNVTLSDTVPSGVNFTGNVTVNGVAVPGGNPNPPSSIPVGTIGPNSTSTVTFRVLVTNIPGTIPNNATVNYVYTVNPSLPNGQTGSGNSNTANIYSSQAVIDYTDGGGMVKSVNPKSAKVGDTVTFTIGLKNVGNVAANNVTFSDTIPTGTTFAGNVTLNGVAVPGANPNPPSSIPIGSIAAGAASTVTFNVTINTLPASGTIPNDSTVKFTYTINPSQPNAQSGSGNSNTAIIGVAQAIIDNTNGGGMVKYANPTSVQKGNTITYTIGLKNTGNTTANNVTFSDTIPSGTTFAGNVTLNGVAVPGANPNPPSSIPIGSIGPNSISTVTFNVTVTTLPASGTIPNDSTINFTYTVDPSVPNGSSGSGNSNTVQIVANQAIMDFTSGGGMIKSASPTSVKTGDTVTYTVALKNTGNATANNVTFSDTIPVGTTFAGNVTVNGVAVPGANPNPPSSIPIGNIGPNVTSTVTFNVTVTTLPSNGRISNDSTSNFTYTKFPTIPNGQSGSGNSNNMLIGANQAIIDYTNGGGMVKSANPNYAKVGDIVTYTVGLKNTGNVTANNVTFSDTIPSGTTFAGNVTLNGVAVPGANPNPPSSIPVGSIGPNAASTVTFNVTVTSIPGNGLIINDSTIKFVYTVDPSVPNGQNGSGYSNTVTTTISQAIIDNNNGGGMVKSANPTSVKIGDTVTYTIGLKNSGNTTANNVTFSDTIPVGTTFAGNVTLNGVAVPGANPNPPSSIPVGSIGPNAASTVTFNVIVNSIPVSGAIPNDSTIKFTYTVDPAVPNGASGSGNSNTVSIGVNQATIDYTNGGGMVKSVNPQYTKFGDTVTYTVKLKNTGNVTANNVTFSDTIPLGTTFAGNVTLNGVAVPGGNPNPPSSIPVGSIGPNATSTVTFNITVSSIPASGTIPNNSTVNFTYTVLPTLPNGSSGSGNSNTALINVNQAVIDNTNGGGMVKSANPTFVQKGDTVTYTVALKNTGNTTANNVNFSDTIPTGTTFAGNVTVNGVVVPGGNPNPPSSVSVGSIAPNATSTVTFNVTITTLPASGTIPNDSTINYTYTVDPALPNGQGGSGNSNTALISANQAIIDYTNGGGMVKSANPKFAKVGDIVTYTVGLKNTGNATATNITFSDTIPTNTTFAGNVTLNGVAVPGANPNPPSSIPIGSIAPNAISTVTFNVTISSIPASGTIPNDSTINFTFTKFPTIPNGATSSGNSNTAIIGVNQAVIDNTNGGGMVKSANPKYTTIGDTVTYTVGLKNTGNVTANSVTFSDTIPTGTTFAGNVTVNGVVVPGGNPNPPSSIPIGSIGPNATSTVTFKVVITTLPASGTIPNDSTIKFVYTVDPSVPNGASGSGNSNTAIIGANQAIIDNNNGGGMVKSADPTSVKIGDVVTYTVALKNTGNTTANSVTFSDTIPVGTTFTNNVTLNGVAVPGANPNPPSSIPVGSIGPNAISTVTFTVTVNSIPASGAIPNDSTIKFTYTVDPCVPNGSSGSGNSNTVSIGVNQATIDYTNGGGMVKSANPQYTKFGDTVTYTVKLKNTGNVTANNVTFSDTIPLGTTFANNVTVNGVTVPGGNPNPPSSIPIGSIAPNATSTVTFKVTVSSIPASGTIPNDSTVNFTYTVQSTVPNGASGSGNSNTAIIGVNQAVIDNTNGGGMVKSANPTFVQKGDTVTYTVALKNTGNTTATNVTFSDTIPTGTTFAGNVTLNGVAVPGGNPNPPSSILVGSIGPNAISTVTFNVTVTTLPASGTIPNDSTVNYTYTVNPAFPNAQSGSGNSNTAVISANQAIIDNTNGGGMVKSANPKFAKVGDIVTYTVGLKNTGNATATNVTFSDTIPTGTTFAGNVTLNGVAVPGGNPNPPSSIPVGSIGPNAISTVTFNVTVASIPSSGAIPNDSTINFTFTKFPTIPNGATGSGNSNTAIIGTNQAIIDNTNGGGMVKSANPKYTKIGDTVTYTVGLKNTGNVTANSVTFSDTIPTGTTFAGNVTVNGVVVPGGNPNPPSSVSVGNIGPGLVSTVTFNVTITTLPASGTIPNNSTIKFTYTVDPSTPNGATGSGNSNTAIIGANQAIIDNNNGGGMAKYANPTSVKVGDTVTYTIGLTNTGNTTANNVTFSDTVPIGTTFANNVTLNGVAVPGANPNPPSSIPVGSIGPGQVSTVTFNVTVASIPSSGAIPNDSTIKFTYTVDPSTPNGQSGSGNSNTINIGVSQAVIDNLNGGGMVKSANPMYTKVGDTVTYTVRLKNTGNVTANNVTFSDTVPVGTTFANNVKVNGVTVPGGNPNPPSSIPVGNIGPNAVSTVSFNVVVNTIPVSGTIPNDSTVNFTYTVSPTVPNGVSGAGNSNTVIIGVNQAIIDNTNGGGMVKSANPTFVQKGDTVTYSVALKNTGNVTANNVTFSDTVPVGTTFAGNVTLNGVAVPGGNPNPPSSIPVGSIGPNAVSTVTFNVSITTLPSSGTIPNDSTINFTYTVNPSLPNGQTGSGNSNTAIIGANQAIIDNTNGGGMVKSANPKFAKIGDTVTYSVGLKNTGNATATNVTFSDTIPTNTTFANNVTLNGIAVPGGDPNPPSSIPVGSIGPGQVSTVTFNITVSSIPSSGSIPNDSTINFTFTKFPTIPNGATGSGNSNTAIIGINQAIIDNTNGGGMVKSANPRYTKVGDTVTYTVGLKNTGNVTANNVTFSDTIPIGTAFANSVTVNGVTVPGGNPNPPSSIPVGSIGPNSISTVTFKVNVTTLPASGLILNDSTIRFTYTVDPSVPNGQSGSGNSNTAIIGANQAIIDNTNGGGMVKSANPTSVKVGDTVTYTIGLTNTGNTTANNVTFSDTVPVGTTFANNVTLNGVAVPGGNPNPPSSIPVGSIGPNATSTVTFDVTVASIPSSGAIPNSSTIKFTYTVDPSVPNGQSGSGNSNTINIGVSQAVIDNLNGGGMVKSANPMYTKVGDTVTYTIKLKNTGNVTANNVAFTDTIPSGTTFAGGVKVNGVTVPGGNPNPPSSIPVGNIGPNATSTVTFNVVVNTIPVSGTIPNDSSVSFTYTVSPTIPNGVSGAGNSNTVIIGVNQAIIDNTNGGGMVKSANPSFVQKGDTVTYSVALKNTGNATANSVTFSDTIPSGTTFAGGVTVNGVAVPGGNPNPPSSIPVGNIGPNATSTVTFNVTITTLPSSGTIPNDSTIKFTYTVNPSLPNGQTGSGNSNTAIIGANQAIIDNTNGGGMVKSANPKYAKIGDTVTYSVGLKNTGNVTANNVTFSDTIPLNTTFANNVTVNGVAIPGGNPNPPSSIPVGSIGPNAISTVTFNITVDSIPASGTIPNDSTINFTFTKFPTLPDGASGSGNSNTATIGINQAIIDNTNGGGMVKSANPKYTKIGDTVTYTVALKNTGNTTANSVTFSDTIPSGTTFAGGVTVNGVTIPGGNPNPPSSIPVGSIGPNATSTVTFKVTITTLPSSGTIPNDSTIKFTYTVNPSLPNGQSGSGNSNTAIIGANQAIIDNKNGGGMVKSANPTSVKVGDTVTYTIGLTNTGNITANNVTFSDTVPVGTTFAGNVTLNGVAVPGGNPNPPSSIPVGSIGPGSVSTVTFDVTVASIPSSGAIPNNSTIKFTYTVDPSVPDGQSGSGNSNIATIGVSQAVIDNANGGGMIKYANPKYTKVGDTVTYTIGLKNTGNVTANNVMFSDTIPVGTTFAGNVTVNGVAVPGGNPNPPSSIPVGNIGPNAISTVAFKVIVNTIPVSGTIPNDSTVNFTFTVSATMPNGQSSSGNSNTVIIGVNQAIIDNTNGGGMVKSANPSTVQKGDTVTYTVALKNTGNATANSVTFSDTIPTGTTFAGGVTVNGVAVPGGNPNPPSSIPVGSIGPNATSTVTFNVTVVTLPASGTIPNDSTIKFTYTVDPSLPNGQSGSGNSNTAIIGANQAIIDYINGGGMVKSANPKYTKVGDTVTYIVGLKNTGNVTANNVMFSDTIPLNTVFANNVKVNGVAVPGGDPNPPSSIPVGSIGPGLVSTVTFNVTVVSIPASGTIPNDSTVNYTYAKFPTIPDGATGSGNSNTASIGVKQAIIDNTNGGGMVKSANPSFVQKGDTVTYTVTLKNTGNTTANNVKFSDTIPSGTTFAGGVTVNGVTVPGANPNPPSSIPVGSIGPNATSTVTFKVTITTLPSSGTIPNDSTINFTYTVDPSVPNGVSGSGNSNTAIVGANQAIIDNTNGGGMVKSANPISVKVGDTVTYTVGLKNTGNTTANNVTFSDTVPVGTIFANNVTVNGVAVSGGDPNPPSSIPVGSIGPNSISTVTFDVTVVSIPSSGTIPNNSTVNFTYTKFPTIPDGQSGSGNSNTASIGVKQATIDYTNGGGMVKSVTPKYTKVGDTVTYTIRLKNTGNTTANNVMFSDTIPTGTTFAGGVTVNGVAVPGGNPNPPSSIPVGNIGPNAVSTVVFKVIVNTIPASGTIPNDSTVNFTYTVSATMPNGESGSGNSNTVIIGVNQAIIDNTNGGGMVKSASPISVKVGDTVTYTVELKNTGNTTANSITFSDTVPIGTTFANNVTVNGVAVSGANPNPPSSIPVGSIGPNAISTVTFNVNVVSIPASGTIPNNSTIRFVYTVDPSIPNGQGGSGNSNTASIGVKQAIIDYTNGGGMVKSATPKYTKVGDTVIYTVGLKNTGNTTANNVTFSDTIPLDTIFTNNVTVNGVAVPGGDPNPPSSIPVGSIGPGQVSTVSFSIMVNSIPVNVTIPNDSTNNFTYTVDPSVPDGQSGSGNSNTASIGVRQAIIDNTNGGGMVKYVNPAFAKVGDTITYCIALKNTGNTRANSVTFSDTIPLGTKFADNVTVNGVVVPGGNPNPPSSIPVGNINPGSTSTVCFKVIVTTLPITGSIPNSVVNDSTVKYLFTIDPSVPNGQSGSGNSNTVITTINQAVIDYTIGGGFMKWADPRYTKAGDTVNYIVGLKNTGNTTANNVTFSDTIPPGTIFADNVTVNGVPVSGGNPNPPSSIPVGDIGPNSISTVSFNVIVNTIPASNSIPNSGTVHFTFTVDPSTPNGATGAGNSNTTIVNVNEAVIGSPTTPNSTFSKSSDKAYADIGETITYTILARNVGNVPATNVFITDNVPNGTSYEAGTLTVNGLPNPGDPNTGINVGTINPNQISKILFKIKVNEITIPNPISNTATVNYNYTIDPSIPDGGSGFGFTNTVSTTINHGQILPSDAIKTSNRVSTTMGDTITYTITAKNSGNVPLNTATVVDSIIAPTSFVNGSVYVNSVSRPLDNPNTGIGIGPLLPDQVATVTFKVNVNSTIPSNAINSATIGYAYTVNPSLPPVNSSVATNITTVPNLLHNLSINKAADKHGTVVGDTIVYTITVVNTGQIDSSNVVVTDALNPSLIYKDSLTVNGIPTSGDISTGVPIGSLAVGDWAVVSFSATAASVPVGGIITNQSKATYDVSVPGGDTIPATNVSNIEKVRVYSPNVVLTKKASTPSVKVGDSFNYMITATNNGDIEIDDSVLTDIFPASFVINQVTVDGVVTPGDLTTGLSIGSIAVGQTKVIYVNVKVVAPYIPVYYNTVNGAFTVIVDDTPQLFAINALSDSEIIDDSPLTVLLKRSATDPVGVTVYDPQLSITKGASEYVALVGDTLIFTVTVANTGDISTNGVDFNSVNIQDMLSSQFKFVDGSIKVDGVSNPFANILSGIDIGTLNMGVSKVITFEATIINKGSGIATNAAIANYNFILPRTENVQTLSKQSNTVTITILEANLTVIKTADQSTVSLGDIITYTVKISNNGGVDAYSVIFTDSLPDNVELINGSFTLNNVVVNNVNLGIGVNIGNIPVGTSKVISYKVKVLSSKCNRDVINSAKATFKYFLNNGSVGTHTSDISSVDVSVNNSTFKQLVVEDKFCVPCQKPIVDEVNNMGADVEIVNYYLVETQEATSNEGQHLNKYKLVIQGILKQVIEYTADCDDQTVHSTHFDTTFSNFIILPEDYTVGSKLEVTGEVEYACADKVNDRCINTSATILLVAKICCNNLNCN